MRRVRGAAELIAKAKHVSVITNPKTSARRNQEPKPREEELMRISMREICYGVRGSGEIYNFLSKHLR